MKPILWIAPLVAALACASRAATTNAPAARWTWSDITAGLAAREATGPERDLADTNLVGKTVALPLEFVRAEQDGEGQTRYLYQHTAG